MMTTHHADTIARQQFNEIACIEPSITALYPQLPNAT
jgi:hypothetical protein